MTNDEIYAIARRCGGIRATVDRLDDFFDDWKWDNSYNWCDKTTYPLFEVRQNATQTFIWIKENQNTDPRCNDYLDENCIIFHNNDDFYDFVAQVGTEEDEE